MSIRAVLLELDLEETDILIMRADLLDALRGRYLDLLESFSST